MRGYIGIDNGVTGSLAYVSLNTYMFVPVPTRNELSYTRAKAFITRIDVPELISRLSVWATMEKGTRAFVERPFVNPKGFKATVSALRALEATLICLEYVGIAYEYVDSKQWQKVLLPSGCSGPELKKASREVGVRLFPELKVEIDDHKDADSLLIAEWARRLSL